jgi:hypothetical protein
MNKKLTILVWIILFLFFNPTTVFCQCTVTITSSGNPGPFTICNGNSITLNAITSGAGCGGATFSWTSTPSGFSSNLQNFIVNPSSSTSFKVVIIIGGVRTDSANAQVNVTPLPVATFSYPGSPFCSNSSTNPLPTFSGGGVAGNFTSSPSGLIFVNPATGQINISASTPGSYTITNTISASGGCAQVQATSPVTITQLPVATFSYPGSPFCSNSSTNPLPTFSGGGVAGTFTSSPAGLNFISSTNGQINLATSNPGNYTITNTISASGGCTLVQEISSITINLKPSITPTNNGPICSTGFLNLTSNVTGGNGTFSFQWSGPNGFSSTISDPSISGVSLQNGGIYTLTVTSNGCVETKTTNVIVNSLPDKPNLSDLTATNNVITTSTCGGTDFLNFNVTNASNTTYQWISSNPTLVNIHKNDTVNSVISFYNSPVSYFATITVVASLPASSGGCSDTTRINVNVNANLDTITERRIIKKQPGNLLIYLENTVDGYQWGFDSLPSLKPFNVSGQVFQSFSPAQQFIIQDSLNVKNYAYWVKVRKGDCITKIYYNGPYASRIENLNQEDIPIEITSTVLPNPNNGLFNVKLSGGIYGEIDLKIVNVFGQLVNEKLFMKTEPVAYYSLDMRSFSKGIYFIFINGVGGEKVTSKFIINE